MLLRKWSIKRYFIFPPQLIIVLLQYLAKCRNTKYHQILYHCIARLQPVAGLIDYIRQGGYVIIVVCLSISNFAHKLPDLHEIFREGWHWHWANEQND